MARIGFIGLGNMGLPMAQNLLKAGHQVEGVDVSSVAVDKLKASGGTGVETAKSAAARADVVITMLPSGLEVRDAVFGDAGLLEGFAPGALLLDTSSSEPWYTKEVASGLAGASVAMVDAPVSGAEAKAAATYLASVTLGNPDSTEYSFQTQARPARSGPILWAQTVSVSSLG